MIKQDGNDHAKVAERLRDLARIDEALKRAGRRAVLEHARAQRKIPVWKNNQVVWELPNLEVID